MSSRLVYQQCVDECGAIQAVVSSIRELKSEGLNALEKRKRLDILQSNGRSHLSDLKAYIYQLETSLDTCSSPENCKKINAIGSQYTSILVS